MDNMEVKLEDVHHSIEIKEYPILECQQDSTENTPSPSSNYFQIKTEEMEINLEDLHHSVDIKEEATNEFQVDQDYTIPLKTADIATFEATLNVGLCGFETVPQAIDGNGDTISRPWVRPIFTSRPKQIDVITEMRLYDKEMFFHCTRFTVEQFDELLSIVSPLITKKSNRCPLNPEQRLAITLRFLATGSTFKMVAAHFRVGTSTVCNVVHETCEAIWNALHERVFIKPSKSNWQKIAAEFEERWDVPHCIGALDGKHIRVHAATYSGLESSNYKQYSNILLLAMCDANYKFTYVDVGSPDSESDGGIFNKSSLADDLKFGRLDLPGPEQVGNYTDCAFPYFIVTDETFPLKENIMRPYPGKSLTKSEVVFNYRLLRVRRIIENTIGILVSRWGIFQGSIVGKVGNVEKYIQAVMCLHNFLKIWEENHEQPAMYCPSQYVDQEIDGELRKGEWRELVHNCQSLQPLSKLGSNNAARKFFETRNHLSKYFLTEEGAVAGQENSVAQGRRKRLRAF